MKKILITLSLIAIAGCKTIDSRGQFIDDNQISELKKKNFTKEQVIELVGSPTLSPDYSPNTWYYASMSLARKIFTMPKVISERVIRITFAGDKVSEVDLLDNASEEKINIVSDYTKSKGTDQNGLQKFVKNFGRFNKSGKNRKHR